jgi:hypothetical protein
MSFLPKVAMLLVEIPEDKNPLSPVPATSSASFSPYDSSREV